MAYSTIDKGSSFMNTVLYAGTGSTNAVTGVGFQPDLIWGKNRSVTGSHNFVDAVRGTTKVLYCDTTAAEVTDANSFNAFGADGFTVGTAASVNGSGNNIVTWNWKANGSGSANTVGDIDSTVSANTTSGFSIVKFTGSGTGNQTVGHGLGAIPKFIVIKSIGGAYNWGVKSDRYVDASNPNVLYLNDGATEADDTNVFGTSAAFTTTTFTVGTWAGTNSSGVDYIAYCWSEVLGYSKFGQYDGNNNADGPFIYTGFKPNFVMTKCYDAGEAWNITDKSRIYNEATAGIRNPKGWFLRPNNENGESTSLTYSELDLVSNGFKLLKSHGQYNGTVKHIFAAFGQPIISNSGVNATAR